MFPDFAFQECFMQTKMIQGQFRLAEYDTGVILDIRHVWKALESRRKENQLFSEKLQKIASKFQSSENMLILLTFEKISQKKCYFLAPQSGNTF